MKCEKILLCGIASSKDGSGSGSGIFPIAKSFPRAAFLMQAKAYEKGASKIKNDENTNKIFHAISDRNENVGIVKYVKFPAFTKQKQLEYGLR